MRRTLLVRHLLAALLSGAPAVVEAQHRDAVQTQDRAAGLAGLRLEAALRVLQQHGLRIVFSSELVRPDMRVAGEPRAKTPRSQLDELVEPHGLLAIDGPGNVIVIVRAPAGAIRTGDPQVANRASTSGAFAEPATNRPVVQEWVRVPGTWTGAGSSRGDRGLALDAADLASATSAIGDDPARSMQSLAGVAGFDDFRSDLAVRASPYRHSGVVIDGIATSWLQHGARERGDTGTLGMIGTAMVGRAALRAGAYPRRHASRIGGELELDLREGSRTAAGFRADVSTTSTAVMGEGPLGTDERGSWIVSLRRSHVEWPVGRSDHQDTVFGFTDSVAKLAYDVTPAQQVNVAVVAGQSGVERDAPDAFGYGNGIARAGMINIGWRSVLGSRTVLTQRVALVERRFDNLAFAGSGAATGLDRAIIYRGDVARSFGDALVETGVQVHEEQSRRSHAPNGSAGTRAGYVHLQWRPTTAVTLGHGLRVADSTLVGAPAVDWWLQAEWTMRPGWSIHGSTGATSQLPDASHMRGPTTDVGLRPERATHVEVGIGRQHDAGIQWTATMFTRRDRDVLREPWAGPSEAAVEELAPDAGRLENGLEGTASGLELMIERQSPLGLSGWIAYSFGAARTHDVRTGEWYRSDFDERHALNTVGRYRFRGGTTIGATLRGGSAMPIPAYVAEAGGRLVASATRNSASLPGYLRLDVRAERPLYVGRGQVTAFVEVVNVLNRKNTGWADGRIDPVSGAAIGFTEPLYPRLVTGGFRFIF